MTDARTAYRMGNPRYRALGAAAITLLLAYAGIGPLPAAAADQQFEAWRKSCPTVEGAPRCVVYTQSGGETRIGVVAVRISVGRRNGGENVVVVDISTPVVQERRFGIGIDRNTPMIAAIGQCDQIACRSLVTGDAADALVTQFKKGREAVVAYFAQQRVPVRARVSLLGFTAAYNSLSR